MTEPPHEPPPPIFNLNAYSPAEIQEAVETVGVKKAAHDLDILPTRTDSFPRARHKAGGNLQPAAPRGRKRDDRSNQNPQ